MPFLPFFNQSETEGEPPSYTYELNWGNTMKKIIIVLAIMLFVILPSSMTFAKSFTIDEVQIRVWVQPNGDVLVNEIFTYALDGKFERLTRSFPTKRNNDISQFEAYLINEQNPVVGNLNNDMLTRLNVTTEGSTMITELPANDQTLSVLYFYRMNQAVKSYESYSDLEITFFDKGKSHDTDYKNVSISYALPGDVGDVNIHGFMHDRQGSIDKVYRNGIHFKTPESQAHTVTATRIFYPSDIMTEQQKVEAPYSLEEAIEIETRRLNGTILGQSPVKNSIIGLTIIFVLIALIMLFIRQRLFAFFGNANMVLEADPLYVSFVDRNNVWHSKSFLAGLFSLVEKEVVGVKMEPAAGRFMKHPDVPEKTFVFQIKNSMQKLIPHEQTLVTWLFKPSSTEQLFHLHDIAGRAQGEKVNRSRYEKKQREFEESHHDWHEEVENLVKEARIFSSWIPKVIQWMIILTMLIVTSYATYFVGAEEVHIFIFVVISLIVLIPFIRHPDKRMRPVLFFGIMLFVVSQMETGDLKMPLILFVLAGVLLYYAIPSSLIISWKALYMKMSMNKFRAQMKNGLPQHLSEDQQNRWLTRAYLLNKSNKKLPTLKGSIPTTLPLAALFTLSTDPLYFIWSTWGFHSYQTTGSWGGFGGDSGGGWGDGGGGGGGDGGGAGAD